MKNQVVARQRRAACLKLTVIALTQLCDNCLLGSTLSKVSRYIKLIKRIVKKIRIFIPRLAIFEFILYLEWLEGKSIKAIVLTQQHQLGFKFLALTDWDAWAMWLISWYADMTYRNNGKIGYSQKMNGCPMERNQYGCCGNSLRILEKQSQIKCLLTVRVTIYAK